MMFDTERFIAEIQGRECIWNLGCASYHNRNLKWDAWLEVCKAINEDNFDELSPTNQKIKSNPVAGGQGGKSVLCHFWTFSANQEGHISPEDFDPTICTHVVYKWAIIGQDLHVTFYLHEDEALDMIHRTVALKERKPGLKVILDIVDHDAVIKEELRTNNRESLKTFAKNAVDFVHAQGFDGISYRRTGSKDGFTDVIPVLREELTKKGYILTTGTPPPNPFFKMEHVLTEEFSRNFDLIVISNYWYRGSERTAIFSPITALESDVDAYTANGVPSEKLVAAIPASCIIMRLCDGEDGGLNSSTCEAGNDDEQEYYLDHSEILRKISNTTEGWVISRDEETGSLYGHSKTRQWASFEDPVSVTAKAALVLERNLAGIAIMNSDMEDFKGAFTENGETFPLTRAAYTALNGGPTDEDTASTTAPSS